MFRLSFKSTHAHDKIPASVPAATATDSRVRASICGYRLEAASRRAGLGSAFGRDRGPRRGPTAAPR
jgi:hypothetical protein